MADAAFMTGALRRHPVQAVMHFAGFKAVGESVAEPLKYYPTTWAASWGCRHLVFSSSATVYGDPHAVPSSYRSLSAQPH